MAALLNPAFLYVGSDKWTAVAAWTALTSYTAGQMVRQLAAPTLGNERVFVCIVAGTTLASEPAWTVTKGAKTAEAAGPTWQECTGQPAVNGDATHTLSWTTSVKSNTVVLGQIIKRDNGVSYQICTTAGTAGSGAEPSFSDTAGTTTSDNTVTWTSLGVVGNFAAFAAPHQRILNADASNWSTVSGSTFFISNAHAETQSTTLTLAAGQTTAATPNRYICVSNSVAPPTSVTTGASVSATGSFAPMTISRHAYYCGISFIAGTGSVTNSMFLGDTGATQSTGLYFENCAFTLNTTSASALINLGNTATLDNIISLYSCTFVFGATAQSLSKQISNCTIVNASVAASGSVPTTLITSKTSSFEGFLVIRDTDLSNIAGTLFNSASSSYNAVFIQNCKLNAGVTMTAGTISGPGAMFFKLHNCDSGTKNYRFYEQTYAATIQQDTTTINNAGASDGTQGISWKIITTANVALTNPYVSPEITIWQDTTGSSKTATIEMAGAGTLTNADIWMELEYPGSSATPIGSVINNRVADVIATAANLTTSSASWAGSPAVKQYLQVTFTPQMKGPVKARVYVAKASTTVYIDPMITVA